MYTARKAGQIRHSHYMKKGKENEPARKGILPGMQLPRPLSP